MRGSYSFLYSRVTFFFIVFSLIILTYFRLPSTFYQQDEWQVMGFFITGGMEGVLSEYSLFEMLTGDGRLLSVPIQYVFYHYFPFQVAQVAVFAIALHFINSILLFYVLQRMFKNILLASLATIFFATASISQQSITWMAASTTTLPSSFFALVSIYSYVRFLEREKRQWLFIALLTFLLSYFFKQSSVFLLFVYPITYLLFKRKARIIDILKKHAFFFFAPLVLLAAVAINLAQEVNPAGLIVTASSNSFERLVVHIFFYPLVSFSQLFIGGEIIYPVAEHVGSLSYQRIWGQPYAPIVRETIAADFVSVILSLFLGFVLLTIAGRRRAFRKPILWGVAFSLLSFLPYAVLEKQTSFLESRYYYLGLVGASVLFACFFIYLRDELVQVFRFSSKYALRTTLILIGVYVFFQILFVHASLIRDEAFAQERRSFLSSLDTLLPTINKKTLFLITGDSEYFLETNRIPFQQGIGYTLMVWYYDSGFIPKELIKSNFLWVIGSEGYREIDEKGFGVYYSFEPFAQAVTTYGLSEQELYGLYYDGQKKELIDISDTVRSALIDQTAEERLQSLSSL